MDYEVADQEKLHFCRRGRLKYAKDNLKKDYEYWNHVLWSDEMKLELFGLCLEKEG